MRGDQVSNSGLWESWPLAFLMFLTLKSETRIRSFSSLTSLLVSAFPLKFTASGSASIVWCCQRTGADTMQGPQNPSATSEYIWKRWNKSKDFWDIFKDIPHQCNAKLTKPSKHVESLTKLLLKQATVSREAPNRRLHAVFCSFTYCLYYVSIISHFSRVRPPRNSPGVS